MPRQRKPIKYRFFVKDQNDNYIDMSTLSEEEQKRHRQNITDRMMGQFGFERDEHPEQPAREGEVKTDSISFLKSVYGHGKYSSANSNKSSEKSCQIRYSHRNG